MTPILSLGISLLQCMVFVFIAPGVLGISRWVKSRLQGRQGAFVFQPYRDLWKLFHRRPVVPETTSFLFVSLPLIIFALTILPGIYAPLFFIDKNAYLRSDLLAIFLLLALGPFLLILAGFDSGSSYAGLGSSRAAFMQFLAELSLIVLVMALAVDQGSTNLNEIYTLLVKNRQGLHFLDNLSLWFILVALCIVILIEAGRMPVDNPDSHLELTLINRGILLDYSGPHLAFLEWAEAMRLTFFMIFLLNLLLPSTLPSPDSSPELILLGLALFAIKLPVLAGLLAVWEITRERLRIRSVANLAGLALFFAMIAVVVAIFKLVYPPVG